MKLTGGRMIYRSSSKLTRHRRPAGLAPFFAIALLIAASTLRAAPAVAAPADWRARLADVMPLLGHRNWILIVDSAYPLQTSPGIETLETNASQVDVVRAVLQAVHASVHVRPLIYLDSELPFVPDSDAPGASEYRAQLGDLLRGYPAESRPHDRILSDIDKAGKTFQILVLKTNMAVPYTSVFIRLDCKYWSADAETRLRAKMSARSAK